MIDDALRVDIWSDIACPWCYVGKRRLEAALEKFPHPVAIHWRAFELDPSAPRQLDPEVPYSTRLAKKYGRSEADAERMIQSMTDTAQKDGLELRFDRVRPTNTFDAHRLLHLAGERGAQDALKERLLKAYMTEGENIGDVTTLTRLAVEVGLDEAEVSAVLAGDAYSREVRADQSEARAHGIRGVPFFVVSDRFGVSGAQPAEALLEVLEQAWTEQHPDSPSAEAGMCGPDGCA